MKTIIRLSMLAAAALAFQFTSAQCPQGTITISITTDNFGSETSWLLFNNASAVVASGGPYQSNQTYTEIVCADSSDCYRFVIYDSFGDGICCFYGNGSYSIFFDSTLIKSGDQFANSQTVFGIGESCGNIRPINVDDSTYTPQQLASGILQGSCVSIFNVSYHGAPAQIGYFSNGSGIGIESGVLLTTGNVAIAPGPNDNSAAGYVPGTPGDSLLELATGYAPTLNAASLDFDFTSLNDTVTIQYVFASEEYNEFVCSGYNDVFGFLISGSGYAPNTNVALIPGTNVPVAINTVNKGVPGDFLGQPYDCNLLTTPQSLANSSYFVDNTGGTTTQFDGYTIPLIAKMVVVPNDTYHVRLVIADVGDELYDSGIFFEAHSFNAGVNFVSATLCPGDSIFAGGEWQSLTGTYYDSFTASSGCDSIIATIVKFAGDLNNQVFASICPADSFLFGNSSLYNAGIYTDTFISSQGCDSIVTLNLSAASDFQNSISVVICLGDSFYAGNAWQKVPGLYQDLYSSASGCDSIVTTNLTLLDTFVTFIDTVLNMGDSILAGGSWRSTGGIYVDTFTTNLGCDSVVFTRLSIVTSIAGIIPGEFAFRIYPNPFSNSATIEYTLPNDAEVLLRIYDIIGRVVLERPVAIEKTGKHLIQFKIDGLGNALFLAELNVDGNMSRKRIVNIK